MSGSLEVTPGGSVATFSTGAMALMWACRALLGLIWHTHGTGVWVMVISGKVDIVSLYVIWSPSLDSFFQILSEHLVRCIHVLPSCHEILGRLSILMDRHH